MVTVLRRTGERSGLGVIGALPSGLPQVVVVGGGFRGWETCRTFSWIKATENEAEINKVVYCHNRCCSLVGQ